MSAVVHIQPKVPVPVIVPLFVTAQFVYNVFGLVMFIVFPVAIVNVVVTVSEFPTKSPLAIVSETTNVLIDVPLVTLRFGPVPAVTSTQRVELTVSPLKSIFMPLRYFPPDWDIVTPHDAELNSAKAAVSTLTTQFPAPDKLVKFVTMPAVGTLAPLAPPSDVDQFVVEFQSVVPPATQYLDATNVQLVLFPLFVFVPSLASMADPDDASLSFTSQ
jgi:hypothetical protein